jgi:hypothetical protein
MDLATPEDVLKLTKRIKKLEGALKDKERVSC